MKRSLNLSLCFVCVFLFSSVELVVAAGGGEPTGVGGLKFPLPLEVYHQLEAAKAAELGRSLGIWETLSLRAAQDPMNMVSLVLFLMAILHTFFTAQFRHWAHEVEERHRRRLRNLGGEVNRGQRAPVSFWATILHFLGEVEAVFGIWLVPLFLCVFLMPGHGWMDAVRYVDSRNFTEPIFVVCIMAIASSQPILEFARICLRRVAVLFGGTPLAWWFSILTIAPLLGSFITEPAAMTIGALLLRRQFYQLNPSMRLRYATLGLLFVNVSVGGTLTHFAAPPVLMVASTWHWNLPYMFTHFGWKAVIGIVISNLTYALLFRREFAQLAQLGLGVKGGEAQNEQEETVTRVPVWVIGVHLFFLAWTVVTLHHPAFFVYGFLFFLAFTQATEHYQSPLSLRGPVLVGFFLASLVVHGGLQGWWISVLLANLSEFALFVCSTILTAFNDNAAITYLASQVPAFSPDVVVNGVLVPKEGAALAHAHALEYAVVVGAVTGGGLTVIANAPNPAGQNLLQRYFGPDGISPLGLFLGALYPTIVLGTSFWLLP